MTEPDPAAVPGPSCPPAEVLLPWADGFASAGDEGIAAHVASCASCQEAIRAFDLAALETGPPPQRASLPPGLLVRLRTRLAALASFELPRSLALTTRAAGVRGLFPRAMDEYRAERLITAEALLGQCVARGEGAGAAAFYLGICRLALGQPHEALEPLRQAVKVEPMLAEHRWYLVQACLQVGLGPEAERELRRIAALPGGRREQARSLARQVKKLLEESA